MKIHNRIISLLMVALMLFAAVPFTSVSALEDITENYTLTAEQICVDSSLSESSAVGGWSFFRNAEFDGCYGNQLSGVAKELYDSFVKKYATDRITGKYTHTFEAPFIFDAEISGGSIVMNDELEEIQLEISCAVQAAMDAFLYDRPEVFWFKSLKSSYGISASGNSASGYIGSIKAVTIEPVEIYSGASAKLSQYYTAVDSALASITVTESRYETLKSIHDYICNNAWYNLVNEQRVHSSEPFFIGDGGVVCEGYSKSFKILCDRLGIPCVLVSGYAGENHMWNYVQMDDGKWYLVDATWDDQGSRIYDTYFLAYADTIGFNDVTVSEERTERNDFSGMGVFSFTYPVLSSAAYGAHTHEWESDYTVDAEPTCTEKGSKSIHCKTCDETKSVTEIPALNHSWDEGIISSVPTCKMHGVKTYTCENDSKHQYTEQLALDADNHEGGTYLKNSSEATCTSAGYTGDTCCSGCNEKLSAGENIPVKQHIFTSYSSDGNATCLADGTKTAVCDVCNKATDTVTDEGSKNIAEHKYSVRYGSSAACAENGERTYVCDVCETAAYTEIIPATGHKGGTATCKTRAKCTACGAEYGLLNANNHKSLTTLKAVAATCTKTGLTEGKKCTDCGVTAVAQNTVDVKAHRETVIPAIAATYKADGKTEGKKCADCGKITVAQQTVAKKVLGKVTGLKVKTVKLSSGTKTTLTLAWTKVTGAEKYEVYQQSGKKWKKIGTTSKATLTVKKLKANKSYKFRVRAIRTDAKGAYSSTFTGKTVPLKTTLTLKAGKKQLTASWKNIANITGYEVQYSASKKFTKNTAKTVTIKNSKAKKTTIKKLTGGKKYYVKVRAYKIVSGKKIYGAWSAVKNVKIK